MRGTLTNVRSCRVECALTTVSDARPCRCQAVDQEATRGALDAVTATLGAAPEP